MFGLLLVGAACSHSSTPSRHTRNVRTRPVRRLLVVVAVLAGSCTSVRSAPVETSSSLGCCGGTPTGTDNLAANPEACPKQVSYTPWPGSSEQMVPGNPVVAVVCAYHPASSNPSRYRHPSRTVLTGDSLDQLVLEFNGLSGPPAHECAAQEDLKEGLYFSYGSSTQPQVVGVLLGGCPIVQNGAMQWVGARSDDVARVLRASQ
jgi:hypothetical protein